MLDINWSDVENILNLCKPYLITLGVLILVAIVLQIAVRKLKQPARLLVRSQAFVACVIAVVTVANLICYGPLNTIVTLASGSGTIAEETASSSEALGEQIAEEGIVLLKNEDGILPLETGNVNVFGWDSVYPVYGGMGSGALSSAYPIVDLLSGMEQAGFTPNTALADFYRAYRQERPAMNIFAQDWTLPEPPVASYGEDLLSGAKDYSDTAIVVVGRVGGENIDIPRAVNESVTYTNNSEDYEDFPAGTNYLQLSQTEHDMLAMVCENFENVVFVYNGANTIQMDFLQEFSQIKAVLWVPGTGQNGFNAFGNILSGKVNPSGRAADTFLYHQEDAPNYANMEVLEYENMDSFRTPDTLAFSAGVVPHFIRYVEGIYVGYRFFETAAAEGLIDYDAVVAYPFGSGLSYTSFEETMGDLQAEDGVISVEVNVTNTGSVAGKHAVQLYVNPPYVNGGIEKASANLIDYGKTGMLEPGASETVTLSFKVEDMASYDAKEAGAYVLEEGDYIISLNSDSHHIIDSRTYTVDETIVYDAENPRSTDQLAASNRFDFADGGVTYLSRADGFANFEEATAAPASLSMREEDLAVFVNNGNYQVPSGEGVSMPTTGAATKLEAASMRGLSYDDPAWDGLLDQLTISDMVNAVALGGYSTAEMPSIGKVSTTDCDGPASINNNFTGVGSIGFPCGVMIANTFSKTLAHDFGERIGQMADEMNVSGWYAPAVNIHRSAFGGRNFEYYSEDPYLSGVIANEAIKGAWEHGVYAYLKHYALNDQESYRWEMLVTWANEQSIREIYLKPFEISIVDSKPGALMSSYNYIGTQWAGGCEPLLTGVLREEWGYQGFVLTDYFANFGYMNAVQAVVAGGASCLSTYDTGSNFITETDNPVVVTAMREAMHQIIYTAVNSRAYDPENMQTGLLLYQKVLIALCAAAALFIVLFEVLYVGKKYKKIRAEQRKEAE